MLLSLYRKVNIYLNILMLYIQQRGSVYLQTYKTLTLYNIL